MTGAPTGKTDGAAVGMTAGAEENGKMGGLPGTILNLARP